jgi:hypothetical protein
MINSPLFPEGTQFEVATLTVSGEWTESAENQPFQTPMEAAKYIQTFLGRMNLMEKVFYAENEGLDLRNLAARHHNHTMTILVKPPTGTVRPITGVELQSLIGQNTRTAA